jgi:AAA15 family ATPase/GTPase
MTALKRLTINNFRGFDSLEIEGFSKINLLVGKNNSGKTSILESIFLVIGMSNPMLPNAVNQIRGLTGETLKQLRYLFHNIKDENKPAFTAHFTDETKRTLQLEAKYMQPATSADHSSTMKPELIGLDVHFQEIKGDKTSPSRTSSLIIEGNSIKQAIPASYHEKLQAVFVAEKNDSATLERLAEMVKRKEDRAVLKTLRQFDDRIQDIRTLPEDIYFDIKDSDELLPISVMGDGIRRFLHILTAAANKKDAFICIDEIENGLHYSAYTLLWKSLLSFAEARNVQLFITTHSTETIAALTSVLEEAPYEPMQEYARVFTVSKTLKAGYKTYPYSFEGFQSAIKHETEIRN